MKTEAEALKKLAEISTYIRAMPRWGNPWPEMEVLVLRVKEKEKSE